MLSQGHLPLNPEVMEDENINFSDQEFKVTILQTTDVHCQIHSHDELFWENDKAVFRKTGGYAHFATYLKNKEKKHKIFS